MITLTITQVSRRQVNTQYGQKTKVNFRCQEYGAQWIGAWENEQTRSMQQGSTIQVQEVRQNGKYYDAIFPKPPQGGGYSGGGGVRPPASGGEALPVLKRIEDTLLRIEKMLANPNDLHVAQNELGPDDNLPPGFDNSGDSIDMDPPVDDNVF